MIDLVRAFETDLVGRACTVQRREHDWSFDFGDRRVLTVSCPWRLVGSDAIELTDGDDRHRFGGRVPLDVEDRAKSLVAGKTVTRAKVEHVTADLCVWFTEGLRLDVFNHSVGYEGWQAAHYAEGKLGGIIALGGGEIAFV